MTPQQFVKVSKSAHAYVHNTMETQAINPTSIWWQCIAVLPGLQQMMHKEG